MFQKVKILQKRSKIPKKKLAAQNVGEGLVSVLQQRGTVVEAPNFRPHYTYFFLDYALVFSVFIFCRWFWFLGSKQFSSGFQVDIAELLPLGDRDQKRSA